MKTTDGKSDRKKDSIGRKMKPVPPPTNNPRRVKNKLYVCGLLPHVLREDVIKEFSVYGKLQEVWVAKKPAGFAFVEFANARDAERVVHELDGKKIFGSQLRIEFAKSKDTMESKEPKRNPQGNPPLLSLEQTFMPLKIPLLGPPMPVSNSKPLLDSKPFITPSYKRHSGASNEAISPSGLRRRLTPPHHKPSKNYLMSPPNQPYYRRRSPDHRHWHYEEHIREEEYYGPPHRSRPYSRRVHRSPVRFPRHDSPQHHRPYRGPISPIRDKCIDEESSGSDKRTFSNVKSQVKSVKKVLRECSEKSVSEEEEDDDQRERSKSYEVERKRHKQSPQEETASHAKYRRSYEHSPPISLSRTRLLGRTPPSPSRSSHRSVSESSSRSSRQHGGVDEDNAVKASQSPPPRTSVSYNKSFSRKSSSINKSSSAVKLSKNKNNLRPESSISSTSDSSIDSKHDQEKEREVLQVKQKGKRDDISSSSSSPSCERRVVKEKPLRHSSSDSRKTPLAYQQRRGSISGRKSPVPHSPPIKLPTQKVYRTKEYIPRRSSPPYPPEYVRSRHSPIPHRPYPPYEQSPEPRRYYEDYPSRPYYVERDEYREPVYYKRKYYTQQYHEPHYYRRPYAPQPPPYRRREVYHEDDMYYPPPRKVPFVYRGKIRNPPIVYSSRGESKKE